MRRLVSSRPGCSRLPVPRLFSTEDKSLVEIQRELVEDRHVMRQTAVRQIVAELLRVSTNRREKVSFRDMHHRLETVKAASTEETWPVLARAVSALTSNPLTISYALSKIFPVVKTGMHEIFVKDSVKVLVLGARAESSLPVSWWYEYLTSFSHCFRHTELRFVGPDLQKNLSMSDKDASLAWSPLSDGSDKAPTTDDRPATLHTLKIWNHNDNLADKNPLHNHPDMIKTMLWADAFVLLNPGIGSDAQKSSWDPTLRLLLQTRKPVVCTAHGSRDLERDLSALSRLSDEEDSQELGESVQFLIPPHDNPYRSFRVTVDENESDERCKRVTTNHSLYAFSGL